MVFGAFDISTVLLCPYIFFLFRLGGDGDHVSDKL